VRASTTPGQRPQGAVAADLAADDLVGIDEVVKLPPLPTVQIGTALGLLLICIALAFIGLGSKSVSAGTIPPGTVKLAGADPSSGQVIPVNLAQPVTVAGMVPAAAHGADTLRLSFSVAGVPLGHLSSPLTVTPTGQFSESLASTSARYLIASQTPTKLQFLTAGKVVAQDSFLLRNHQSPFLSVPGAVAIALVLFVAAYIESLLRTIRRQRKKVTGHIGLVILGGLVGVTAVVWAWLIAATQPASTSFVVCAVIGAAGGVAAGLAAARMGQRRRMRGRR